MKKDRQRQWLANPETGLRFGELVHEGRDELRLALANDSRVTHVDATASESGVDVHFAVSTSLEEGAIIPELPSLQGSPSSSTEWLRAGAGFGRAVA